MKELYGLYVRITFVKVEVEEPLPVVHTNTYKNRQKYSVDLPMASLWWLSFMCDLSDSTYI